MSHTPREKRSKNKDGFRPPQTPPRSSTAVVESPHHQMTSHGTRLKNNGQMLPPGEIANSSQAVLRTAMRSVHPSTVMQNPSANINSTQQRTLSVKQYGAGYIKTTTFNDHVSVVKHGEGGIKPKIGGMDHLYDRLMTLKEPVLDEILKVIDDAKKRKLAKTFQQRQYHGTDNDSSDGDDEAEDDDDVNGENAYKLKAKGLPWKKRKHHRHHSKKVDYHKSIGFRNFFKIFKKKNRDRPVPDLVRCAKEAYKMLSTASRYRYRNLRRYKTAGIVRRRVKPCSDTESN